MIERVGLRGRHERGRRQRGRLARRDGADRHVPQRQRAGEPAERRARVRDHVGVVLPHEARETQRA